MLFTRVYRLLPLAVAVFLVACGDTPPPPMETEPAPPLATKRVQLQEVHREQVWDGVVEAVQETTLSAQTNALVLELPYDVGDPVKQGDVLVRFADVEQQARLRSAQAQVALAQAAYDEAQANWKRVTKLHERGLVSRAQLDQAVAQRDTARAALHAAKAVAKAASQQVDYTVVRAPFDGIVTKRHVNVGEAVQSGPPVPQALVSLISLDDLRVEVQIPQSVVDAIRHYRKAEVWLDPQGIERVQGDKVTVFPYADPDTHTFRVRVALPTGIDSLYPGMTVRVGFAVGTTRQLTVPTSALVQRGEVSAVYVIGQNNTVSLRQLRLGHRNGDTVEVLAGLVPGDEIVLDPDAAALYLTSQHASGGAQ